MRKKDAVPQRIKPQPLSKPAPVLQPQPVLTPEQVEKIKRNAPRITKKGKHENKKVDLPEVREHKKL